MCLQHGGSTEHTKGNNMDNDKTKKPGFLKRFFGSGKKSCCCNIQIEEVPQDKPAEPDDHNCGDGGCGCCGCK